MRSEIELVGGADLLDPAVVHQADAVRHDERLVLVVRDIEDGDAESRMQLLDLELHLVAQLLVERAERLVHEDDRRPVDEAARERDPLLLAAGELAREPLRHAGELHGLERVGDGPLDLGVRQPPHAEREGDVLEDGQVREQGIVLENHADVALKTGRWDGELAVDPDPPRSGAVRPATIISSVVLPEPEGPRRVRNSPSRRSRSVSSSATTGP